MRLVQLLNPKNQRKIALAKKEKLHLLGKFDSNYDLVFQALNGNIPINEMVEAHISKEFLAYEEIWDGKSNWKWLPCFDHPRDVNSCMVSGTGLTHKASAQNREKMNTAAEGGSLTDSMKMYLMGEEGGKPEKGKIGVQPEWFYKGNGSVLKGHREALEVPAYALNGGEEPEIAGIYIINNQGEPVRIGFATGNEYSDHVMEKMNYLYLAPSKIRSCSIGPELVIEPDIFQDLSGEVKVLRKGKSIWEKEIKTGVAHMAHSLENLEYHHFKYANHRVVGQAHIHFFGTGAFSFGDNVFLENGDEMLINWPKMGKPLVNPLQEEKASKAIQVIALR